MTRKIVLAFVAAASFVLFAPAAQAVTVGLTITVDENGNGSVNNGLVTTPLSFTQPGNVLTYSLPTFNGVELIVTRGDVLISEPPGGALGDVIRFDTPGPSTLSFYSASPGDGSLADIGLPTVFLNPAGPFLEGPNGILTYTPMAGQPGFSLTSGFVVTYDFISDTPVPAALPLFATGIGGLGLLGWRRRSRSTQTLA
jgi:hypothetical protein